MPVPDDRLERLAELSKSAKVTPTTIEFVDIAGLVAGASKGEGLGNQFLGHIREVDAIVHVVRCFEDENVVHVSGSVDPARDIEIVETELLLKDLESVEKRIERTAKKAAKSGDKKCATSWPSTSACATCSAAGARSDVRSPRRGKAVATLALFADQQARPLRRQRSRSRRAGR